MKRIVLFLATFLFSFTLMAQREQEGVIRFLDIPVDGSAYDFAGQLKNKDFYPVKNSRGDLEYWKGPFEKMFNSILTHSVVIFTLSL